MTTELTMLALSIVLGLMQIMIAANASTRQRGADWNVGSRDEGAAARRHRRLARPGAAELPRDLPAVRRRGADRRALPRLERRDAGDHFDLGGLI